MAFVFDNVRFRKMLSTQPWDAYEMLYKHYRRPLINAAFRLARDRDEAYDIVQETFYDIWNSRNRLLRIHEKSIENYLAQIVRFKTIDYFKRKRRYKDIDIVMRYQDFASDENTLESVITRELYREFRKRISHLPPRQKECLTMKIDRNMAPDDIAAELKISRKTVELCQNIATKKLTKWATGHKE